MSEKNKNKYISTKQEERSINNEPMISEVDVICCSFIFRVDFFMGILLFFSNSITFPDFAATLVFSILLRWPTPSTVITQNTYNNNLPNDEVGKWIFSSLCTWAMPFWSNGTHLTSINYILCVLECKHAVACQLIRFFWREYSLLHSTLFKSCSCMIARVRTNSVLVPYERDRRWPWFAEKQNCELNISSIENYNIGY